MDDKTKTAIRTIEEEAAKEYDAAIAEGLAKLTALTQDDLTCRLHEVEALVAKLRDADTRFITAKKTIRAIAFDVDEDFIVLC